MSKNGISINEHKRTIIDVINLIIEHVNYNKIYTLQINSNITIKLNSLKDEFKYTLIKIDNVEPFNTSAQLLALLKTDFNYDNREEVLDELLYLVQN